MGTQKFAISERELGRILQTLLLSSYDHKLNVTQEPVWLECISKWRRIVRYHKITDQQKHYLEQDNISSGCGCLQSPA